MATQNAPPARAPSPPAGPQTGPPGTDGDTPEARKARKDLLTNDLEQISAVLQGPHRQPVRASRCPGSSSATDWGRWRRRRPTTVEECGDVLIGLSAAATNLRTNEARGRSSRPRVRRSPRRPPDIGSELAKVTTRWPTGRPRWYKSTVAFLDNPLPPQGKPELRVKLARGLGEAAGPGERAQPGAQEPARGERGQRAAGARRSRGPKGPERPVEGAAGEQVRSGETRCAPPTW